MCCKLRVSDVRSEILFGYLGLVLGVPMVGALERATKRKATTSDRRNAIASRSVTVSVEESDDERAVDEPEEVPNKS